MINDVRQRSDYAPAIRQAAELALSQMPGGCAAPRLDFAPTMDWAQRAVSGPLQWIEKVPVQNCGRCTMQRVLALWDGNGAKVLFLPRGDSRADPPLVVDAGQIAGTLAVAQTQACQRPPRITDTLLPDGPHPAGQPWRERWIMDRCGTAVPIDIQFWPAPQGGTTFNVRLAQP